MGSEGFKHSLSTQFKALSDIKAKIEHIVRNWYAERRISGVAAYKQKSKHKISDLYRIENEKNC